MKAARSPIARRQHRFDLLAHAARDHRRRAAGADGNDDIAAIDDGGKDESGMREVVHHIDGQPDRLRAHRHRNADIAGAGAKDCDHAGKVGNQRIAGGQFDPGGVVGIEASQVMIAINGIPAHPCARGNQQPQFCAHEFARSDEQHLAALQIQEHRQIAHQTLAFPNPGVD